MTGRLPELKSPLASAGREPERFYPGTHVVDFPRIRNKQTQAAASFRPIELGLVRSIHMRIAYSPLIERISAIESRRRSSTAL